MEPARPAFVPDPALSREEMESLQREIAAAATFEDDLDVDVDGVALDTSIDPDDAQTHIGTPSDGGGPDAPVVVGVDQAFVEEQAVSAIVAIRGGTVIERVHAVEPLSIPYVPGLLSFREGGPILAAFEELTVEPDLALFDGSGRIHFRQAGLATHLGVTLDLPSIGVAKRLLCGRAREPTDGLPEGARVAIEADERVELAEGTLIGYAVQTRQFPDSRRVNPVYVSPGHRVGAALAADLTLALAGDYKLPEPVRLADAHASTIRDRLTGAS